MYLDDVALNRVTKRLLESRALAYYLVPFPRSPLSARIASAGVQLCAFERYRCVSAEEECFDHPYLLFIH